MNGHEPIAGRHEQHADVSIGIRRGFALNVVAVCHPSYFSSPNRKLQLLEQCARIGFTPPSISKLDDVFPSFDVLEVSPCLNKLALNNSPS